MQLTQLLLLAGLSLVQAQETILGAFVFHRHGDRTAKYWPPARLTSLGADQVQQAGQYYRNRYIAGSSPIYGIEKDIAQLSQLNVEAPVDIVLQAAAIAWLQGLYPPVGSSVGTQTLRNGSKVEGPLDGYQLIPVNLVTSAVSSAKLEDTVWLQGASGCANAIVSSNNYFLSQDYVTTKARTDSFYKSIYPVVSDSMTSDYVNYKNGYAVFDLINVATINNVTIKDSDVLTPEALYQLRVLANQHEYNLAFNASESIRAIAGATLAAQILQQLNTTLYNQAAPRLSVQFGTYASSLAFFGLSQLDAVSENFTGIVDYASSMAFELITNASVSASSYPTPDKVSVRFTFVNGSAAEHAPQSYPLFGQKETVLPYTTFVSEMNKIAIGDQATWCKACGNSTGACAAYVDGGSTSSSGSATGSSSSTSSGSSGISTVVAGVIGAMVTLAVIFGLEALIMAVAGLRLVSKRRMAAVAAASHAQTETVYPLKA